MFCSAPSVTQLSFKWTFDDAVHGKENNKSESETILSLNSAHLPRLTPPVNAISRNKQQGNII